MTRATFCRKIAAMNNRRFKNRPVAAGSVLRRATANALRRRGFAEGEVIARWSDIVGPELAAVTAPEKLQQRRGDVAGAVLHIRVDGGAAVKLQHMAPVVLERINGFYGYRAVDRLKLIQGPLPERQVAPERSRRPLTRAESTSLAAQIGPTRSPALRHALERLGASVMSRRGEGPNSGDPEP